MCGVAVGGLGLLAVLAVLIGRRIDQEARTEAWLRIATARRINAEHHRTNEQRTVVLDIREAKLHLRELQLDLRATEGRLRRQ